MATHKPKTLQDVFERNKYDLPTSIRKSRGWFDSQVTLMTKQNIIPHKVIGAVPED